MFLRKSSGRGYTIIELMISSTIALMILSVVYMFFRLGRMSYDYSEYSYIMSREVHASLRWVMRDLRETSLTSIRVYEEDPHAETPVLTFHAASKIKEGKLDISEFGTPLWQKHVIYTLDPDEKTSNQLGVKVGVLKRYEISDKDCNSVNPVPLELPSGRTLPQGLESPRVVLRNVVYKGQNLKLHKENGEEYNGFKVSFVRRTLKGDSFADDSLSDENPALSKDFEGNTKLVNVEFTILEASSTTGQKNILGLSYRINPRN